jgi:DNA topoisomerase-6 subunit A
VSARKIRRRPPRKTRAELDLITIDEIEGVARRVHQTIRGLETPRLSFPVRALSNVSYDEEVGYLEIEGSVSERTLTVNTAKGFAQTLLLMKLAREHIRTDERATKREAYYISKNWGKDVAFDNQPESDTVLDDVEAMFAQHGVTREQLRFIAEQHGGQVVGRVSIIESDPKTGREQIHDCTTYISGAYAVPKDVESLRFESDAKFILCIETGGTFNRLHDAMFWDTHKCILVEMGGVPSRMCRRFVRRLSDDLDLPVYTFTDCDPYGFANIYRTLKVGSGNAAHINQFFCVPRATFLGVTPQDIIDYKLPTHAMEPVDEKRAKDALKNDPFFQTHKRWVKAFEQIMRGGQRAEQQAFAAHGLKYVYEVYLPQKLADVKRFLP